MLDLGCGAGRHAFEAYRRGARVVAARPRPRRTRQEWAPCSPRCGPRARPRRRQAPRPVRGRDPPAVPRRLVRRGHRRRDPRAHAGRRRRHGRDRPGAAPRRDRRGHRARLAARADLLGAVRRVPRGARRPRPHLHPRRAHRQADRGRPDALGASPRARPALPLLVAEVRGRRARRRPPRRPRATTGCWSGTSCASPPLTRLPRPRSTRSSARASSSTREKPRPQSRSSPNGSVVSPHAPAKPAPGQA